MPDQIPPPSQPYGPFTDVLTGPLSGQRQQVMQQPSGWGGQGAALANYANAFIKSAQVGQREKLERSEMEKASHERNFDSVHSYIQNSDTISLEGKQAAEKAYLMGKFSQVANHASQGEKQNKDNPLFALTKAITGAVMGPGELKNHKDMAVDVNALLSIANDERFKIDPRKMAADAGSGVADVLRGAAGDQPGIAGGAALALPATSRRRILVPDMGQVAGQQSGMPSAAPVTPGGAASPMVNRFPALALGESAMAPDLVYRPEPRVVTMPAGVGVAGNVYGPNGEYFRDPRTGLFYDKSGVATGAQDLVYRPQPRVVTMPAGVGVAGNVYGPNGEYFRDPKTGLFYDKSGVATGAQDLVYRPQPGDENVRPELIRGVPAQSALPSAPNGAFRPSTQAGGEVLPARIAGGGQPLAAQAPGESTPGKQLTQDEALQNPQIKERLLALQQAGISWDKDPYLSRLIGGLPKTAAPKMLPGTGNVGTNPDTGRAEVYHRYQDSDGRTYNVFDGVALAAKPTAGSTRTYNIGEPITLRDAIASGGKYENALEPGTFFDPEELLKTSPNIQLRAVGTTKGIKYIKGSADNKLWHIGGRDIILNSREGMDLANGAGLDVGLQNPGYTSTTTTNPDGSTSTTTNPRAPGVSAGPRANAAPQIPPTTPPPGTPPAKPQQGGQQGGLTPAEIDTAKTYYRSITGGQKLTGRNAQIGIAGAKAIQKGTGLPETEVQDAINELTELIPTYKVTQKRLQDSKTLTERLDGHIALLVDAAARTGLGKSQTVNQFSQWLAAHTGEYPELKRAQAALLAVNREYGGLLTNNFGNSSLTVHAQEEANKFLNTATPLQTLLAGAEQIKQEAAVTSDSLNSRLNEITQQRRNNPISKFIDGTSAQGSTQPPSGGQQKVISQADFAKTTANMDPNAVEIFKAKLAANGYVVK